MSFLQTFQVLPHIPEKLSFIEELSRNLWWCWNLDAIDLFRRIDPKLWDSSGRNPVAFLTMIDSRRLEDLADDNSFLANMKQVEDQFREEMKAPGRQALENQSPEEVIAYFSMEFGIHESLPFFAGGLGVLAGDHLKAASDMGIPVIGIGIFYQNGYFHQFLNHDGWQQEDYPRTDVFHLPIERARDESGREIRVTVAGPEGDIHLVPWKLNIGRVSLLLLDTNVQENPPHIRDINARLYHSESKIRLAQEVILGIGGMRVLEAMNIKPVVCHLNEGHCTFSSIERISQIMKQQAVDLPTAIAISARTTVFTTHTPVAAGHDEFAPEMVRPYLQPFTEQFGISDKKLLQWGQINRQTDDSPFSMFVLGMRYAQYCNGVSQLHGSVARAMWSHVWPAVPREEVPISHITNGIHVPSWISIENSQLFQRYLGPQWQLEACRSEKLIERINDIYDEELWRAHEMSRTRLIRSCRKLMADQYGRRNAPKSEMQEAASVLDDDVLTIAFARRFATYKRATLLLHDLERFKAILRSKENPVQFIFSGKAHPKDNEGKELIQQLVQFSRHPEFRHKIIFLEDYNINIARHLVQGADVWLNTPRRPYEACGTSGMKAAANGVLNVSVLDGWWCEGYDTTTGWAIGGGEEYEDARYQDAVESRALYNILENDIIPCFYEREAGGVPTRWLKKMKSSMQMILTRFCAHHMTEAYYDQFYKPAVKHHHALTAEGAAEAARLADFHKRLLDKWDQIKIEKPVRRQEGPFRVGSSFTVTTDVYLGELSPEEVAVEMYYGRVENVDRIRDGKRQAMTVQDDLGDGKYRYECALPCQDAGRFGFTVRLVPGSDEYIKHTPGLITWA
ncbi:MAG: alpha-glucan family phosphorylase [Desulfosudaceae bacterium]